MLKFYNTLTRKKENFKPIQPDEVRLYTCGPTVYDYPHIGNFRAYIFEDILRRYLKYTGYRVIQVMNITDIDDKIIKGARASNQDIYSYAEKYTKSFFKDLDALKIERAEYYPKATEHITQMVELIKKLLDKGYAYYSEGSIYFKISSFPKYGKLSKLNPEDFQTGYITDSDEYTKEDIRDFVLWKTRKEGEPYWQTELGEGRPGWHIECSAMSMKYLGETLDIHTGGVDNIFPHHENEIAQSEAATGKPFVRYWLHCRHLIVEGEKMSKSKGNFYTLEDLLKKGYNPLAIRYLLLSVHYRKPLNFTFPGLEQAQNSLERLEEFLLRLNSEKLPLGKNNELSQLIQDTRKDFEKAMNDDLNTSAALGAIFTLVRKSNISLSDGLLKEDNKSEIINFLDTINTVFYIMPEKEREILEPEIKHLVELRDEARREKDFKKADEIREELLEKGIILQDTKDGVRWRRKKVIDKK
jgi:cysteinyl-tRNA synthetase